MADKELTSDERIDLALEIAAESEMLERMTSDEAWDLVVRVEGGEYSDQDLITWHELVEDARIARAEMARWEQIKAERALEA